MRRRNKESGNAAKVWMSVFIALLMVFSVFGIIIGSQAGDVRYGKHKFTVDQTYGYYVTEIDNAEVYFYTLPPEVIYLNISNQTLQRLLASPYLITTFDPNTANDSTQTIELARFDLARFMKDKAVLNSVSASALGYEALPILTCANASSSAPIVVFNTSDVASVVDLGDCVYLNGKGSDFLRFRDKILYSYFGVI